MNFKNKLAVALFAVTTGVFGLSSIASAGQGGAAGAAAFSVDPFSGNVTGAAVSAAVGKQDAAATATNIGGGFFGPGANTAASLGSAGTINVNTTNGGFFGTTSNLSSSPDPLLGAAQANNLSTGQVNPTAVIGGTVVVGP
jgi:hypothetical protein